MKQGKMFFLSFPKLLFCSWDNEILTFQVPSLESKHSLVMKFGQFLHYKREIFIKNFYEKCGLKSSSRPFLIFKESSLMLIWRTNFDSFAITYLIQVACFENFIFHVVFNSLQTLKGLELVFRADCL